VVQVRYKQIDSSVLAEWQAVRPTTPQNLSGRAFQRVPHKTTTNTLTNAKLSQMVPSKWKSLLLKTVDPFFHKHGAGAEIPVKNLRNEVSTEDLGFLQGASGADPVMLLTNQFSTW
jgi:hypothetical protein